MKEETVKELLTLIEVHIHRSNDEVEKYKLQKNRLKAEYL